MHCDTISELQKRKGESLHRNQLCVDVERLKRAGAEAQFFACFVNAADYGGKKEDWMEPCKAEKGHRSVVPSSWDPAYENVLNMISSARKAEDHSFTVAASEQELDQARGDGRLAGILTLEEGGVLNGNIERVKELYEEGIRLITLTWNYENCLGSPNSRDPEVMSRGLKPFGKEVVERMNDLGMELSNHTYDHKDLTKLTQSQITDEIEKTSSLIQNAAGVLPDTLRPPGGSYNDSVQNLAGLPIVKWSIDTKDWKTKSEDQTYQCVMDNVEDGSIVLMHDIHEWSVDAAIRLIPDLMEEGYKLVTVQELAQAKGITLENGKVYEFLGEGTQMVE